MSWKNPKLTVDAVIVEGDNVVLVKRKNNPFKDYWALPGGFVEYGEKVEDAVVREAKEETGLKVEITKLTGVYSDPKRDPRGHTVSAVYLCKKSGGELKADTDAKEVKWFEKKDIQKLAFDHKKILEDALK
jgi:8-oxo-dGTP diphosphatase